MLAYWGVALTLGRPLVSQTDFDYVNQTGVYGSLLNHISVGRHEIGAPANPLHTFAMHAMPFCCVPFSCHVLRLCMFSLPAAQWAPQRCLCGQGSQRAGTCVCACCSSWGDTTQDRYRQAGVPLGPGRHRPDLHAIPGQCKVRTATWGSLCMHTRYRTQQLTCHNLSSDDMAAWRALPWQACK